MKEGLVYDIIETLTEPLNSGFRHAALVGRNGSVVYLFTFLQKKRLLLDQCSRLMEVWMFGFDRVGSTFAQTTLTNKVFEQQPKPWQDAKSQAFCPLGVC